MKKYAYKILTVTSVTLAVVLIIFWLLLYTDAYWYL